MSTRTHARRSPRPAYLLIANRLEDMIATAALRPGDRLPSIRELVRTHRVSVPTIQRAMEELEMRGLVAARARAGFYVTHQPATATRAAPSAGLAPPAGSSPLGKLVQRAISVASDPTMCQLGPSGPSAELFPTTKLQRALSAEARRAGVRGCDYSDVAGAARLRQEIARRSPSSGCCLRPQEIIVTAGCTEALAFCLRAVTTPGDTVAIESPAYYGMLLLLQSLNLHVVEIPADPVTGLDIRVVRRVLAQRRPAALLMSGNFSHPSGALMPDEAKQALVDLLAHHATPLIEDDIYGDLYFGDRRPPPLKAYDRHGLVLLCDSFSKSIAPGYRVGWTAPGRYTDRVLELKFAQSAFTATLPQLGIAGFLSRGGYERHLRTLRKCLRDNVQSTAAAVARHFPDGTRWHVPAGGNFLWVELPQGCDSLTLFDAAAARGVSIAPGPMFAADGAGFGNHIRLNCSRVWTADIERGLALVGALAAEQLSARIGEPPSTARN